MQIPRKLQAGDRVKQSTYNTINGIIDYLHTQKIVGDNQSIKVSQQTSGVTISAIKNPHGTAGTVTPDIHPFKIQIDGEYVKVLQGYVYTNLGEVDFTNSRLTFPSTAGTYNVYGFVVGGWNFNGGLFYALDGVSIKSYDGIFTFLIGKIKVEIDENNAVSVTILQQNLYNDLSLPDVFIDSFSCLFTCNTLQHNAIFTAPLEVTEIICNGGYLYVDGSKIMINALSSTPSSEEINFYLQILCADTITASIISSVSPKSYYSFDETTSTSTYNIKIASVSATFTVEQYITEDIIFDALTKIDVDDNIKEIIKFEKSATGLKISSSIDATKNGILIVQDGVIKFLELTSDGVLVFNAGTKTINIQQIGEC